MSTTDYVIDIALVLVVLLQVREHPLTNRRLIRPLLILGFAVANYLTAVPTAGNDLVLAAALALLGAALGIASGLTATLAIREDGVVTARSGWLSVSLWIAGMGSRFVFVYWITHGGAETIGRFSAAHSITSGEAWTVALLAMAAGQVLCRVVVLAIRRRARSQAAAAVSIA